MMSAVKMPLFINSVPCSFAPRFWGFDVSPPVSEGWKIREHFLAPAALFHLHDEMVQFFLTIDREQEYDRNLRRMLQKKG